MSRELPQRWARRLIQRGFTDGRFKHDVASMGALAAKTGIHTSTISAAIAGKRKPSVETVRLLVAELGPDVADWLGVPIREPYTPPAEADLLTPRQRKALDELIRSMADEQEGGGEDGERDSAPTQPPAPGPGNQPGVTPFPGRKGESKLSSIEDPYGVAGAAADDPDDEGKGGRSNEGDH